MWACCAVPWILAALCVSAGLIGVAESRADTPHRFYLLRIEYPRTAWFGFPCRRTLYLLYFVSPLNRLYDDCWDWTACRSWALAQERRTPACRAVVCAWLARVSRIFASVDLATRQLVLAMNESEIPVELFEVRPVLNSFVYSPLCRGTSFTDIRRPCDGHLADSTDILCLSLSFSLESRLLLPPYLLCLLPCDPLLVSPFRD